MDASEAHQNATMSLLLPGKVLYLNALLGASFNVKRHASTSLILSKMVVMYAVADIT